MSDVSKLVGYVVTGGADASIVSKLVGYVVTGPPELTGTLKIQTWTFTIDDHDFMVVQLSDQTLVYDFGSNEWYTWGTGIADAAWRVVRGISWNSNIGGILPGLGGSGQSNVVCGDGVTGTLYFLDPELPEDYDETGTPGQPFSRVITGQLSVRGHNYVDCPAVELTGSNGETNVPITDSTVTLTISDDKGHTFWSAGTQTVTPAAYDVALQWTSLGSFTGPGRLFRITDFGALIRVDGLDMPDG